MVYNDSAYQLSTLSNDLLGSKERLSSSFIHILFLAPKSAVARASIRKLSALLAFCERISAFAELSHVNHNNKAIVFF